MRSRVQIEPTERRMCSVLFADIVRSTMIIGDLDPEDAVSHLGPVIEQIMTICEKNGATTLFTGDGALAVFGSPHADEDHAAKAIASAQEIIRQIAGKGDQSPDVRIGIHTGELLVSDLQHTQGHEQAFLGPVMNISSKIEAAARKNVVTVSETVIQTVGTLFDHEPVGELQIDGRKKTLKLFEIKARNEQRSRWESLARRDRSPLVGREAELARLREAWCKACQGEGNSVLLVGAAGVGKSRLTHELVESLPTEAFDLWEFNCFSLDQTAAYLPIIRALNTQLKLSDCQSDAELEAKLSKGIGNTRFLDNHTRQALFSIFRRARAELEQAAGDPSRRRRKLNDILSRMILSTRKEKPLLLLFEDLHWADQGTLDVVQELLSRISFLRVLVVLTSRNATPFTSDRQGRLQLLPVPPLGEDDCRELISRLLGPRGDDGLLRDFVDTMSGRTPLFVEEFAHHLRDRLDRTQSSESLHRNLADLEVPARVQPLIASRIDTLDSENKKALQVAAVGGLRWTWNTLTETLQRLGFEAQPRLTALIESGFLETYGLAENQQIRFSHALVQKVSYRSIPRLRRSRLHRAIFEALHAGADTDDLEIAQAIARHADQGELWQEATEAYLRCGELASRLFSFEAAVSYFDNALRCVGRLKAETGAQNVYELELRVRRGLRVSLVASGNFRRILEISHEAEKLCDDAGDRVSKITSQIDQGIMTTILFDIRDARRISQHALDSATELGDARLQANAAFALAQAAWFHGDYESAKEAIDHHAGLFKHDFRTVETGTTGSISVLGIATRANALSMMGQFDKAEDDIHEALEIAGETGKVYDRSFALIARGISCWKLEDDARATEALRTALKISSEAGIDVLSCFAAAPLARVLARNREFADARLVLTKSLGLAREMQMEAFVAWLLSAKIRVLQEDGRGGEAEEVAAELADLCRQNGYFGRDPTLLR